jgi:hypothetical protein
MISGRIWEGVILDDFERKNVESHSPKIVGYRVSHINGIPFLITVTMKDNQNLSDIPVVINGRKFRADAAFRKGIIFGTLEDAVASFRGHMIIRLNSTHADGIAATALKWIDKMNAIWTKIMVDEWERRMRIDD